VGSSSLPVAQRSPAGTNAENQTPDLKAGAPGQEQAKDGHQESSGGKHGQLEPENQSSDVLDDRTELRRAGAEQDQGSPQSSANVQETPIRPKAPTDRTRTGTRQSLNPRRSGLTDSDDEPPSSDTPDLPKSNSAEQTLRDFIITGQADDVSRRVQTQNRSIMGFSVFSWQGRERSKRIENLYVEPPQKTTLLLPLTSTGFYPDGNSPGNTMENSGKWNPQSGFKSPRAEEESRLTKKDQSFGRFLRDF